MRLDGGDGVRERGAITELRRRRHARPGGMASVPMRVLVADGDPHHRGRVRDKLEGDARFELCGEVDNAAAAIDAATRRRPAVCLLDVHMPGGGIEAAWEIKARMPRTIVVMLASSASDDDLFASLRAGASGYLLKDMNLERLPAAVADAVAGRAAIPRSLVSRVVAEFRDDGPRRRSVLHASGPQLTSREWQVVELLTLGLSTAEIAERLYVSTATVRSHVAAVLHKLGVPDRESAVRLLAGDRAS
jgi:DNA-binding NarL/FixJ family response regulator